MKALHESKYKYLGTLQGKHVFQNIIQPEDAEVILINRARFVKNDGSSIYFDPVSDDRSSVQLEQFRRVAAYASKL